MYQAGDYVVYAGNGLCLVENIGVPGFQASGNAAQYYFLRTADEKDRIYVPVNTALPIRNPLTSQEAEALLAELPSMKIDLPPRRDYKVMVGQAKTYQNQCKTPAEQKTPQVLSCAKS